MNKFPEIEGIQWVSDKTPDLVIIGITLEDKKKQDLDIPGLDVDDILADQYIDLDKLAGVRSTYNEEGEMKKGECFVDVEGVIGFIARIDTDKLIEAWKFFKEFRHDTRNI